MIQWLCLLLLLVSAPFACRSLSAQEQPAVIASPSERTRAELRRVVAAAFNGQPVTLADDALTRDSMLTIERRMPSGPQGRVATGRALEAPEQLRLVLRGTHCVLVSQANGAEWELKDVQCIPETKAPR